MSRELIKNSSMKWARLDLPWWSIHTFASSVICWAGHSIQSINPSIQGFVTTFQQLFFSIQITDIKNVAWGVYYGSIEFCISLEVSHWVKDQIYDQKVEFWWNWKKRQNEQKLKLLKNWSFLDKSLRKGVHIFTTNLTLFAWQHQVSRGSNSLSKRKMNAKRLVRTKKKEK